MSWTRGTCYISFAVFSRIVDELLVKPFTSFKSTNVVAIYKGTPNFINILQTYIQYIELSINRPIRVHDLLVQLIIVISIVNNLDFGTQ
jgi:hypothetical protein